jgi:DNA-binding MarR family transcriptional regulator
VTKVLDAGQVHLAHLQLGEHAAERLPGHAEAPARMSTLAGCSNSSLSRLSRAVARLEAKDWVRRAPDPGDGRFTLATLTDAGSRRSTKPARATRPWSSGWCSTP